jgi:hypothetical protein
MVYKISYDLRQLIGLKKRQASKHPGDTEK